MKGKILKRDIARNKVITSTLFLFILMAAMLVSSAVALITQLFGAMDALLERSNAAHFAQLHMGELTQSDIDDFSATHSDIVKAQQTVELLGINGSSIFLADNTESEADSAMENSFVVQNKNFDFLLGGNNEPARVGEGEIAVPIYHMQNYDLKIGDTVTVRSGDFTKTFTIVDFVKDSLMNPSLLNSKRFLVSENDWQELYANTGKIEYLIEFQLTDLERLGQFESLYQNSGLPQKGTGMAYTLVRLINAMSDGISAAVIILISLLLMVIAALCLRFTLITTMEEDYREIGVMKAIGISANDIRGIYLAKYVILAVTASIAGYLLSVPVGAIFTRNITLYMGSVDGTFLSRMPPLAGSAAVCAAVILYCRGILRRFRTVSAVEAIRSGSAPSSGKQSLWFPVSTTRFPSINIFLACKEVLSRFPIYSLLCVVFVICAFLMIVPLNFLSTMTSPQFVTYMGAGECDIRVDLQHTEDIEKQYADLVEGVSNDPEVEKYAALYTSTYQTADSGGELVNIKVETGDFSVFPLTYTIGGSPLEEKQIALSSMNAEELGKAVGDIIPLYIGGREEWYEVCGIYQDVTNGGKTAKAILPFDVDNIIWFTVNLDVKHGINIHAKMEEYKTTFYPAKVTDVDDYIYQTLNSVIDQLRNVVGFSRILSIVIACLITAMFFKMLMAKEHAQILIIRGLGFSAWQVRLQYVTRALLVLVIGIVLGTVLSGLCGSKLAGLVITGISDLKFVVNPVNAYIISPLLLIVPVTIVILLGSMYTIKKDASLRLLVE